jgi:hypothetical protein
MWGSRVKWTVGMRAKWFGWMPVPVGSCNPPAPRDWQRTQLHENLHVIVEAVRELPSGGTIPMVVRTDDGFAFDPSVDPWYIVDGRHPGWEHPDVVGRRMRGLK